MMDLDKMTLERWLWENGMDNVDLARELGVTRQAVSEWLTGKSAPAAKTLAKLEEMTNGLITARSFPAAVR